MNEQTSMEIPEEETATEETTALAIPSVDVDEQRGLAVLGSKEEMLVRLEDNAGRLQVAHDWITKNFEPGIDFGKADDRSPKETLLKPGAEKVCNLFNTTPRWTKDADTWEMLGDPKGTVCFLCHIIDNATGAIIGQGMGAATVGDRQRDANKTIKIAKKCALVDAALSTFSLSERFTQDTPVQRQAFAEEKEELKVRVSEMRTQCDSSMTNNQFLHKVASDYLKEPATTIGAIRRLRKAIVEQELFDLATGEKVPQ